MTEEAEARAAWPLSVLDQAPREQGPSLSPACPVPSARPGAGTGNGSLGGRGAEEVGLGQTRGGTRRVCVCEREMLCVSVCLHECECL